MQTHDISKMTIDQVAALPAYDIFRGRLERDGTPSERFYAQRDMALASAEGQRVAARYDHMVEAIERGWKAA